MLTLLRRRFDAQKLATRFRAHALLLVALGPHITVSAQIEEWHALHDGGSWEVGVGVSAGQDGGVYVIARDQIRSGSGWDLLVLKYGPDGILTWQQRFHGPGRGISDSILGAVDAEGDLHAAATVHMRGNFGGCGGERDHDYGILKYDKSGELIWSRTHHVSEYDLVHFMATDTDGNVYVTGLSGSCLEIDAEQAQRVTLKYAPDGSELWARTHRAIGQGTSGGRYGGCVALDGTGNVYVASGFELLKYDAEGELAWERPNEGAFARGLSVSEAGEAFVAAQSPDGEDEECVILKYSADGVLRWETRHDACSLGSFSPPPTYALDPDGNFRVLMVERGESVAISIHTYASEDGRLLASARLPSNVRPALTVDETGSTYAIAGASPIKYDRDGNQVWVGQRGDQEPEPGLMAITVDSFDNVYVTGSASNESNGEDVYTAKYVQGGSDVLFLRGDCNGDGKTNIADPVCVLNHLFGGGPAPSCMQTADANDDNAVNIADPTYELNHLFNGGAPLPPPVGGCGMDPTPAKNAADNLSCEAHAPCAA